MSSGMVADQSFLRRKASSWRIFLRAGKMGAACTAAFSGPRRLSVMDAIRSSRQATARYAVAGAV